MVLVYACSEKEKDEARSLAAEMNYEGSMMQGSRNAHATLAEIAAHGLIGGEMVRSYDYDIVTPWGLKVDVKNKVLSYPPKPHYEVSIFAYTAKQACDYLLFTATPKNGECVWICGGYGKKAFLRDAELKRAGTVTGTNGLTYKRDNYVMTIEQIGDAEKVIAMLRGESTGQGKGKTIEQKLAGIHSLDELNGFANRSRVLGVELPRWTDVEREAILRRKFELENGRT